MDQAVREQLSLGFIETRGGQVYAYKPSSDVRYGTRRRLTQKGHISNKSARKLADKAHILQAGEMEDTLDEVAFLTRKN